MATGPSMRQSSENLIFSWATAAPLPSTNPPTTNPPTIDRVKLRFKNDNMCVSSLKYGWKAPPAALIPCAHCT